MSVYTASRRLHSESETAHLARAIAPLLGPGDIVLLSGSIGAGKTFFARNVIQTLLTHPEDIPSPTFTLVQTYAANSCDIWHCDLYRLTHPDEVFELGLDDAFETSICLVEWPDRLGSDVPQNALTLTFEPSTVPEFRKLSATTPNARWAPILDLIHE